MIELCFATNNAHKLSEVKAVMPQGIKILSLADIGCTEELPETGTTLEGNSLQKAAYLFQHYHVACFADDSGLEVDALGGAPGVYSARYAGPQRDSTDNISLLLKNLVDIDNRRARFRTIFALVGYEADPVFFEGTIAGEITTEPMGSQGFGYDPVFKPAGFDVTFAQMSSETKNRVSHRAMAVERLVNYLLTNQ